MTSAIDALVAAADMTLSEIIPVRSLATTIRESAEHVLTVALAREGIEATPEKVKRLAKEIGNNSAAILGCMEIR